MKFSEELLSQVAGNLFTGLSLELNDCEIDDEMAVKLAEALKQNSHIKEVSLQNNRIGDQGAIALADVKTLEVLKLDGNYVKDNGLKALLKSYLIVLHASSNQIEDAGLEGIEQNEFLSELNLSANRITFLGAERIAKNTGLTFLNLSFNDLGENGAIFLSANTSIIKLILYKANITSKGAAAFENNQAVETLELSSNSIGKEGVLGLSRNKNITDLSLGDNNLTDSDIKPFMSMQSLVIVDLSDNKITNTGALELLSKFLPENLSLDGNEILIPQKLPLTQLFDKKKEEEQKRDTNISDELEIFITALRKASEQTKFEILSTVTAMPGFSNCMQEARNAQRDEVKRQKLES